MTLEWKERRTGRWLVHWRDSDGKRRRRPFRLDSDVAHPVVELRDQASDAGPPLVKELPDFPMPQPPTPALAPVFHPPIGHTNRR